MFCTVYSIGCQQFAGALSVIGPNFTFWAKAKEQNMKQIKKEGADIFFMINYFPLQDYTFLGKYFRDRYFE